MKKLLLVLFVAALLAVSSGTASAQGVLFGLDASSGNIVQLDPDTGALLNSFAPPVNPGPCSGLAYANGRLFFQSCDSDIYELDPDTGAVLNDMAWGGFAHGLGFSGTELFVLGGDILKSPSAEGESGIPVFSSVQVLDPNDGTPIRTVELPVGDFAGGLSYGRGSLFLNGFGDLNSPPEEGIQYPPVFEPLYEIDAATGDLLNEISTPELGVLGAGYSSARGTLFVGTGNTPDTIYEIDPDTGAVINSFAGNVFALAADEAPALAVPGINAWGMAAFVLLAGISAVVILRRKTATA